MSYLDRILDSTRARVREAKESVGQTGLEQRLAGIGPPREFSAALRGDDVAVIAEIKRASPSGGVFDANLPAGATADAYARGGAAALSVLTEPEFFKGRLEDLNAATTAGLPVLRKDFVVDEFQVMEARAAGADAVLLILRIVDDARLGALLGAVEALGLTPLVEVHTEAELERALRAGARVVGVNQRDLATFEVDPDRTSKLAPQIPKECSLVALSGVGNRADVERMAAAGVDAVLVGEALVTAPDPEVKVRELAGVSRTRVRE
jgi:indole-3-glycerol phosphate synthase